MLPRAISLLLLTALLITGTLSASKALSQNCYCDVSTACDQLCCCDSNCPASATTYWSNYNLCANDGFAIPFCSTYVSSSYHVHDLSQGLRLIYTIIKRLFCVSRTNFVSPSTEYTTTSTSQQVPAAPGTTPAVNQHVLNLAAIATYPALPMRDSLGLCAGTTLRDMNSIQNKCRTLVTSTTTLVGNAMLDPAQFVTANGLASASLIVHRMSSTSLTGGVAVSAFTLAGCSVSGTTNVCEGIRQIKLFFVQSTGAIDYTSSYLVVGQLLVNNPTYVSIQYSYTFVSAAGTFPFPSYQGYTVGAHLNLLLSATTATKIFNPVNLAFRNTDGTCRATAADNADAGNLVHLQFGVNSVLSCVGISSTLLSTNLIALFNYVGGLGISSTSLSDYVQLTTTTIPSNQNIQLVFYYVPIGTQLDPQYQIVHAKLQPAGAISTTVNLYVEYEAISSGVFMNVPSPPTINAQLPSDFLYPFYVA